MTFLNSPRIDNLIFGDKTIPVLSVRFCIINLQEISPNRSGRAEDGSTTVVWDQVQLIDDRYKITIDKVPCFYESYDNLLKSGGFNILYNGDIVSTKEKGSISYVEAIDLQDKISYLLSWISGGFPRLSFFKGFFENEFVWEDFSKVDTKIFEESKNWFMDSSEFDFNSLWLEFLKFWDKKEDKLFIVNLIDWYLEACRKSNNIGSSIIIVQSSLELIYNWLIVEQKKIIRGKDAENISASNKIRLILNELRLSSELPTKLINLIRVCDENQSLSDAPDVLVLIRNAIVHGQVEKRKVLSSMDEKVFIESLDLLLLYLELSILYILKFNGTYRNRCLSYEEMDVPWMKNSR